MIIVFSYVVSIIIIGSQLYRLKRFTQVIKNESENGNHLQYNESSWLWYGSQGLLALITMILNLTSTQSTDKAIFIVLTAMFLANLVLGVTFKRIYYNDKGFLYQQRFIPFTAIESIEKANQSGRTYALISGEEVLYMDKKRAVFIQQLYELAKRN